MAKTDADTTAETGTTDKVSAECAIRAIYAIDIYAEDDDLARDPIPLDRQIGTLGYGETKCDILAAGINNLRRKAKKKRLKSGAITPSSTIQSIIDLVCK